MTNQEHQQEIQRLRDCARGATCTLAKLLKEREEIQERLNTPGLEDRMKGDDKCWIFKSWQIDLQLTEYTIEYLMNQISELKFDI